MSTADPTPTAALPDRDRELVAGLDEYCDGVLAAIGAADPVGFGEAHGSLCSWSQFQLVPHLVALEQLVLPELAKAPGAELLAQALVATHRVIAGLVDAVNTPGEIVLLAGDVQALRVTVRSHLASVDNLALPALAAAGADLDQLTRGVTTTAAALAEQYALAVQSDLDAAHAQPAEAGGGGCGGGGGGCGGCGGLCGVDDDPRSPEQKAADRAAVKVTRTA